LITKVLVFVSEFGVFILLVARGILFLVFMWVLLTPSLDYITVSLSHGVLVSVTLYL